MRRKRALAMAVGLLTSVAVVAGCGHGTNGNQAQAAPPRPAKSLAEAMLDADDLPDWYVADGTVTSMETLGNPQPPRPATCQPLDDVWLGHVKPMPKTEILKS